MRSRSKGTSLHFCIALALCPLIAVAEDSELLAYPVHLLQSAPELDGKIEDDPAWTDIPRATGFHVLGGRRLVQEQSSFKMAFTANALYVAAVCDQRDIASVKDKYADGDQDIYKDNVVEIFVWPAGSDTVLQVLVNTRGARTDCLNNAGGEFHDLAPSPVSRAAAFRGAGRYSVEIEIPFDKLGFAPSGGDVWRGNVCRNDVSQGDENTVYSTWARLVARSLEPHNFARLVFHARPPQQKGTVIHSEGAAGDDVELHLVVDLKFDEGDGDVAHGQSAIINDGKIVAAKWAPGKFGYALAFQNDGDHVMVPSSESLAGITKALTLECWVHFDLEKLAGRGVRLVSCASIGGMWSGFYLEYQDEREYTRCLTFVVAGGSSSNRNWHYAEDAIQTSGWRHVLVTYDPKLPFRQRAKFYVDGQRQNQARPWIDKAIDPISPSREPLYIGAVPASKEKRSTMTRQFKGRIDEVKVWDRALSDEDIARLYGSLWAKSAPLAPRPSHVVPDGKPRFQWTESGDGTPYVFELAAVPDFSGAIVARRELPEPQCKLPEALSPGVYYWRVWSTDDKGKPTASCEPRALIVPFKRAFVEADTTPPIITSVRPPRETTALSSRPEIHARWTDDCGLDLASARLLLDGRDVTALANATPKGISFTPAADLAKGAHTIEISVKDTSANPANRVRQRFAVGEPYRSVVTINDHRRLTIDGEPFFPRIIYIEPGSAFAREWRDRLPDLGFNVLYGQVPAPAVEVRAARTGRSIEDIDRETRAGRLVTIEDMDAMARAGGKWYAKVGSFTPRRHRKTIEETGWAESIPFYDRRPEVLAYMLDEPNGRPEGLEDATILYEKLLESGHNRPAIWVMNQPGAARAFGPVSDGISIDCYPVPSRPMLKLAAYIDRVHELLDRKKPVWFIVQAFDWRLWREPYSPLSETRTREDVKKALPEDFVFTPTVKQIRCMTYLALVHDVQGIHWWSLCGHYKALSITDFPDEWTAFLELGSETRHLSPTLLSTAYVDVGGNWKKLGIHLLAKSVQDKLYVIAVNPGDLPVAPEFNLPAPRTYRRVDVLFENRSTELTTNTFRDLFEPAGVHVYRID